MTLGFIDTRSKYIYVGSKAPNSPWYFYEQEKKELPIFVNCLSCYLINIEVTHKEFKGKTSPKLLVSLNAGENYKVQCGLETWFAKSLIVRLSQLDSVALSSQLYLHAYCGNDNKVVFAGLQNAQLEWVKKPENFEYKQYSDEVAIAEEVYKIAEKLKAARTVTTSSDLENIPY